MITDNQIKNLLTGKSNEIGEELNINPALIRKWRNHPDKMHKYARMYFSCFLDARRVYKKGFDDGVKSVV